MPGGPLAPSKCERFFVENDDLPCQIESFQAETDVLATWNSDENPEIGTVLTDDGVALRESRSVKKTSTTLAIARGRVRSTPLQAIQHLLNKNRFSECITLPVIH